MASLTPEQACINYAVAVAKVKRLTLVIKSNPCTAEEKNNVEIGEGWKGMTSCIALHWSTHLVGCAESYRGVPDLARESFCPNCETALTAIEERKEARTALRYAKMSVNCLGKRLSGKVVR